MRRKEKRQRKFLKRFLYLDYRRLSGEIVHYGYSFSFKGALFFYSMAFLAALLLGFVYKLSLWEFIVLFIVCLIVTPSLVVNRYKKAYDVKRFSDVNKYMEKMLYYFKSSGKILTSLVDMQKMFPEGRMSRILRRAIDHIEGGKSEGDVREEALKMIEAEYGCSRMRLIHQFLLNAERNGGDCRTAIGLLLEDRRLWAGRSVERQKKKQTTLRSTVIALALTALLCVSILYLPAFMSGMEKTIDISGNVIVQISSLLFIILLIAIFTKAYEKSNMDFLLDSGGISREKAFRQYRELADYQATGHLVAGLAWSLIPFTLAFLIFMMTKSPFVVLLGIAGILFMLNEHRIGHKLTLRSYTREVEKTFPEWLLYVALLLNTESVPVALAHSLPTAPAAIAPPLTDMLAELEKDPCSELPYLRFLGFLNLTDVQETMATLFSMVNGSGSDAEGELGGILDHNFRMTDKAEQLKNEDKAAVMELYIILPGLAGALKLVVDMSVLLMSLFTLGA